MEAEAEAEAVALKGDAEAYAIEIKAKAEVGFFQATWIMVVVMQMDEMIKAYAIEIKAKAEVCRPDVTDYWKAGIKSVGDNLV